MLSRMFAALALFSFPIFADDILLKDGNVVSGKILSVTASQIEYDPSDSIPFDVIPRESVQKITSANGRTVLFLSPAAAAPADQPATAALPEKFKEPSAPRAPTAAPTLYTPRPTKAFLEGEIGWNGGCGLGVKVDGIVKKNISLNLGMGLSGWGFRVSAGSRYYFNYPFGGSLGLFLSNSFGLSEFKPLLEYQNTAGQTIEDSVSMKLKPVFALHGCYRYDLQISRSFKLFSEFGYALPLHSETYTILEPGKTLTPSSKSVMKFLDPGGLMLVLGLGLRP